MIEPQQLGLSGKPVRKLERKRAHQVYKLPGGKRVVGASTIAKLGDFGDGLLEWYRKCVAEGIDPWKARDEAADIGSVAHFKIETFLKNEEPDVSEYSPAVVAIADRAFAKFLDFWNEGGFSHLESELQLISLLNEYGGTMDCIARDRESRLCILDWKFTNYRSPAHGYQLAGYRELYDECREEKLERFCVLRVPKHGDKPADPKWFPSLNAQWRVFQDQLALYRSIKAAKDEDR